jgi:hypothetical protein
MIRVVKLLAKPVRKVDIVNDVQQGADDQDIICAGAASFILCGFSGGKIFHGCCLLSGGVGTASV